MKQRNYNSAESQNEQEWIGSAREMKFANDSFSKYIISKGKTENTNNLTETSNENFSIPETILETNENTESFLSKSKHSKRNSKIRRINKYVIPKVITSNEDIKNNRVCVIKEKYLSNDPQEPWPNDVKLYQPYEVEQILLTDNANCLAVQTFLKMCNLNFEIVSKANAEFMSPSGKVPFIKCGQFIIAELEGIVQFVNNKGISLTANLDPDQKTDVRAYMSLIHNVLENAELYICWCDKETYNEVTKPRNGSVYPWPLNYFQTWNKRSAVIKRLKLMGWYNKSINDVFQEVENCCQALSDRLEGKEYFFGKRLTEVDALVFGHIYSILSMPLPAYNEKLVSIIKQYDILLDHCKKIYKILLSESSIENIVSIASSSTNSRLIQSQMLLENKPENNLKESTVIDSDDTTSLTLSDINTEDLLLNDDKIDDYIDEI